jgi:hypothetical protein
VEGSDPRRGHCSRLHPSSQFVVHLLDARVPEHDKVVNGDQAGSEISEVTPRFGARRHTEIVNQGDHAPLQAPMTAASPADHLPSTRVRHDVEFDLGLQPARKGQVPELSSRHVRVGGARGEADLHCSSSGHERAEFIHGSHAPGGSDQARCPKARWPDSQVACSSHTEGFSEQRGGQGTRAHPCRMAPFGGLSEFSTAPRQTSEENTLPSLTAYGVFSSLDCQGARRPGGLR